MYMYHHGMLPCSFQNLFKLEANFIITSPEMLIHIVLMVAEQTSNNLLFCTKVQNCAAPYLFDNSI